MSLIVPALHHRGVQHEPSDPFSKLSALQIALALFVHSYYVQEGNGPTFHEIRKAIGKPSLSQVDYHIHPLLLARVLMHTSAKSRTLRPVTPPFPFPWIAGHPSSGLLRQALLILMETQPGVCCTLRIGQDVPEEALCVTDWITLSFSHNHQARDLYWNEEEFTLRLAGPPTNQEILLGHVLSSTRVFS